MEYEEQWRKLLARADESKATLVAVTEINKVLQVVANQYHIYRQETGCGNLGAGLPY